MYMANIIFSKAITFDQYIGGFHVEILGISTSEVTLNQEGSFSGSWSVKSDCWFTAVDDKNAVILNSFGQPSNRFYVYDNGGGSFTGFGDTYNFTGMASDGLSTIDGKGYFSNNKTIATEDITLGIYGIGAVLGRGSGHYDINVFGTDLNETILGNTGFDYLDGAAGNDKLYGGDGNDELIGGDGNDRVDAGVGDDLIVGGDGAGNDTYNGGVGADTVKYTSALASITVDLNKGTAKSTVGTDTAAIGTDKLSNIENVIAGDYADTIVGSKVSNILTGGLGNDTFVFNIKPSATNIDTITDFTSGDKIALAGSVLSKLKGDKDLSDNFALDLATTVKEYLIYNTDTGKLYYDADGSGTKSKPIEVAIIGIDSHPTLAASDFTII
jgi:Ca2+-binding RTX toxin-like protein